MGSATERREGGVMITWPLLLAILAIRLLQAICWAILLWMLMDWAEQTFGRDHRRLSIHQKPRDGVRGDSK
jgi:hypothetical protein